jgi:hypothetical protein
MTVVIVKRASRTTSNSHVVECQLNTGSNHLSSLVSYLQTDHSSDLGLPSSSSHSCSRRQCFRGPLFRAHGAGFVGTSAADRDYWIARGRAGVRSGPPKASGADHSKSPSTSLSWERHGLALSVHSTDTADDTGGDGVEIAVFPATVVAVVVVGECGHVRRGYCCGPAWLALAYLAYEHVIVLRGALF